MERRRKTHVRAREFLTFPLPDRVSRKKHEVIAIAVRHDRSRGTIRFMMASNFDVPRETEKHFRDMWKKLQRLAERFQASRGPHDEDISPRL
jgi:hypothetical protein